MSDIVDWYKGRKVVVTGCASGIGAALLARLLDAGAHVVAIDYREPKASGIVYHPLDLRSGAAIDEVAAAIDGPIDALFNCAGIAPEMGFDPLDVVRVNFIGLRSLTDALLPKIGKGGSVTSIASLAGRGWRANMPRIEELLATGTFEEAEAWAQAHPEVVGTGYIFSKEAVTVWTMRNAASAIARGIRMNATSPGPVRTALMDAIDPLLPPGMKEKVSGPLGRYTLPGEQAEPLFFLGSGAAIGVNGAVLPVDGGQEGRQATTPI